VADADLAAVVEAVAAAASAADAEVVVEAVAAAVVAADVAAVDAIAVRATKFRR
jgi:hypothetical protein